MRGTRLRGVLEVREDFLGRTFRMMVAAQLGASVWVLCAYEKKARRGIRTPASLIARRPATDPRWSATIIAVKITTATSVSIRVKPSDPRLDPPIPSAPL